MLSLVRFSVAAFFSHGCEILIHSDGFQRKSFGRFSAETSVEYFLVDIPALDGIILSATCGLETVSLPLVQSLHDVSDLGVVCTQLPNLAKGGSQPKVNIWFGISIILSLLELLFFYFLTRK